MPLTDALIVEDLVAGYRGRPIARVERLVVEGGTAAVLGGASGAGKTTALLAISGLADRLRGSVRIGGEAVDRLGPRARDRHRGAHIGMIFQDLHLVAGLSAIDNMLLAPFANRQRPDRGRASAMLDRLGLGTRAGARAETLSRGEAQRVAIARAVLMDPQLTLADEPTASLDDDAAAAVIDLLLEVTRTSGAGLLIATHDARVRAHVPLAATAEPAR